jgi:UDP-N-acetylmuramate dehydrogenase
VGVPGTLGGALIMNAGTRDLEIGRITKEVEVMSPDGGSRTLSGSDIRFEYRSSSLAGQIVCFATLQLEAAGKDDIMRTVQKFLENRLQTQPIGTLNVGSIFKNQAGHFAAQLIEKAGLKGMRKGNAQVSEKHANFIVNCGGAKARDVRDLIFEIQRTVRDKFGVALEPEVKMVGRW